jgi:hypothetical protein
MKGRKKQRIQAWKTTRMMRLAAAMSLTRLGEMGIWKQKARRKATKRRRSRKQHG